MLDFTIPGYDVIERIGSGGMAGVYRARQHSFDRSVALKVLKPDLSEDDAFCQRFIMESLIIAKLNHSNIVQVYDVGEIKNNYFIAMEFLSGGDLKSRLKSGLSLSQSIEVMKQLGSAINFAHKKNIVHRDLKPDNVMFREDGAAVLTDFGIAKETTADINLTQTGLIVGTPKYMSPEQIRGADPSPAGDIYSLGIMFYEMLVGTQPFKGADLVAIAYQHFNEPVPKLPEHLSAYQSLLEAMLEKDSSNRTITGADIVNQLQQIESGQSPALPANSLGDSTKLLDSGPALKTVLAEAAAGADETVVTPAPQTTGNIATPTDETIITDDPVRLLPLDEEPDQNNGNKGYWKIIAAASMLTAASGIAYFTSLNTSQQDVNGSESQSVLQDQTRIDRLLAEADSAIVDLRLTTGENNAFDIVQTILNEQPNHVAAQGKLTAIAQKYLQLADNAIQQKSFNKAKDYLNKAEQVDNSISTDAFYELINEKQAEAKNATLIKDQFMIEGLLNVARLEERSGNVDAAIRQYRKVVSVDPNNREANQKLESLTSQN